MRAAILLLGSIVGWVSAICVACGADRGDPEYRLEGACDPPPAATAVAVSSYRLDCDLPFGAASPLVATSQSQLDALLGGCAAPTPPGPIDFAANQALLVRGYGDDGGLDAELLFVVDDGAHLELGLIYRPAGFPFPNLMLIVPRSAHSVVLDACTEVCVSGCDQALP